MADLKSSRPGARENADAVPASPLAPALAHAALSQLAEGVIVADAAGRIVFVNDAAARLHGLARLDVPTEEYADAYQLFTESGEPYPPEELPLSRAVRRGETVLDARWRIRRPDGSEILAVGSARPVLDAGGTQVASVLTLRDDAAHAAVERAEQADRRAAQILQRVNDAHVAFDRDLRYVAANATAERVLQRPRSALIGRTLREAFPESAGSESERQYRRVLAERTDAHWTEHYTGDGLDAHVEVDAYPTEDGGIAVFWRDVSARVRAEASLRALNAELAQRNELLQAQQVELEASQQQLQETAIELEAQAEELQSANNALALRTRAAEKASDALWESEARHRLAVEAARIGTWTWDLVSDTASFDARVREIFAFPSDAPLPRVDILATRVHPDDRARVMSALGAASDPAGNGRYEAEYRVVHPDGGERWVSAAGVMRFEGDGATRRPVSLIGTVIDVTARRAAETALAEREQLARTLIDAIPTLAWTARADGYIDWYNARWYEYTGTTPEMMAGWGWQSVHDPAVLPAVLESWRHSIATGKPFEMTFPLRGSDGRFRAFLTRVTPITDDSGQVSRWFGTNTDVEMERAAREHAEAANRAKGQFLAVMSHELRTPLNAIAGYVDLLLMEIRGPLTPAQREDLERVQRSQQHLLGLINDVLNFAKLEAGRVQFEMAEISLQDVFDQVTEMVEPQARSRGLALESRVCPRDDAGRSVAVSADREKLQQVLLNLLSNAIKFTEPPGTVTLSCETKGDAVRIAVRDTGIGIPSGQIAEIFDPFVRIDTRFVREREGTGLGLSISRDLARGMGGDLSVESVEGEGSTFTVTLRRGSAK